MLSKPFHDARHVWLERTWYGEVQQSGSNVAAILEVMSDAAGHEHEGASIGVSPFLPYEEAHRPFDDVEDVVFRVRVCSGSLRVWFEPPLRDGVARRGLRLIGFEDGADPAIG